MRFANVRVGESLVAHVRTDEGYLDVAAITGEPGYATVDAIVKAGPGALDRIASALGRSPKAVPVDPAGAALGPAIADPGKIFCLGRNYYDHAIEIAGAVPSWPEIFVRVTDSLTGPFDEVQVPASSTRFDFEGELGVVIGRDGRGVKPADAMRHVAGYVTTNDFSARDWQRAASQWTPGKNFDGTCPVGPEFVTADELGDRFDLSLETLVNGETMQKAMTSQLIVDIPTAIEFLSCFTTLRAGDLILTGTPGGVGDARKPPVYLKPGDVVETVIERVGTTRNAVVAEREPFVSERWTHPVKR